MSYGAAYGWGCVGGLIVAIAIYVVPELNHLRRTGELRDTFKGWPLVATLSLMAFYTAVAGVAALFNAHPDLPRSLALGITGQGAVKGVLAAIRDAARPDD